MENGFSQDSNGFKEMTPLEREAAERKTREAEERKTREREAREARERERQREVAWKRDRDQQERELKIRERKGDYILRDPKSERPLRTSENEIRQDLLSLEIDRRLARDPSQSSMSIKTQLCREVEEKNGRVSGGVAQQLKEEGHLTQYRDDKERQRQIDNMRQRERDDIGRRRDDLDRGLER
jgi:hypothetical protein